MEPALPPLRARGGLRGHAAAAVSAGGGGPEPRGTGAAGRPGRGEGGELNPTGGDGARGCAAPDGRRCSFVVVPVPLGAYVVPSRLPFPPCKCSLCYVAGLQPF